MTHQTLDELDPGMYTEEVQPELVYQALLENKVLAFQQCNACSATIFPPRVLCPSCGGTEYGWASSSGTGEVYSVTVVSSRKSEPYCVALVDIDDGPRMMTNIATDRPHAVAIGARVAVGFTVADETVPVFSEVEVSNAGN